MKNLILGAAVAVLAAACGGGGKPTLIDANGDALFTCNPVAQTGCKAGEKCTWIVDIDGSGNQNEIGHIGCTAVGGAPFAEGATCADAASMSNGGADNCVAGTLCIASKCKPICDPQLVSGTAAGACKTDFSCSLYAGVFESGGAATAGVCEPNCDPLTQRLKVGTTGIEACGSADPARPGATCVFGPDPATFVCAPTGSSLYTKTDRVEPLLNPAGRPYPNGCAPGFVPGFVDGTSGPMKRLCSGLCAPLASDVKIAAMDGHKTDNQGDISVIAKLPTEAVPKAGNAVCAANIKGADDLQALPGEDCRFFWAAITGNDPTQVPPSPYNNTLGICFPYEKFVDIKLTDGAMVPEKSCAELPDDTMTVPPTDPYGSARDNGCYPLAAPPSVARQTLRGAFSRFRLSYGEPLARHIFD